MGTAGKGSKSKTIAPKSNKAQSHAHSHAHSHASKKSPKKGVSKATAKPKKTAAPVKGKLASLKEALLGKKKAPAKAEKTPLKTKLAGRKPAKPVHEPKPSGKGAKVSAAPATATNKKADKKAGKIKAAKPAKAGKSVGGSVSSRASGRTELGSDTVCREVACEGLATTVGYCRLHYIKNWKKIQRKVIILREKKLNSYIEELVLKYPDKYIEAIREDLDNDKEFSKVIHDLDLDESVDEYDPEGEADEGLIDNIRREIEDEGETF